MSTAALFDNAYLFDPLGHLTDAGLQALTEDRLDTLGRLEASEHLSFCDFCLARYTALVEHMPQGLQAPMRDLVPQVQALMRRRSFRILTNRYFSAVAAVVLAIALWRFGLFGTTAPIHTEDTAPQRPAFSEMLYDGLTEFSNGFHDLLDSFHLAAQEGLEKINDTLAIPGDTPTKLKE